MRFWQAIVVAQMSAGSVYADRIPAGWPHFLAEGGNMLIGAGLWVIGKWCFGPNRLARINETLGEV